MPDNKKHHYVPRFYLKRFSRDSKSINIWNIPQRKIITTAPYRDQCYKNYFYGKEPNIEKALGLVESNVGSILTSISDTETLPEQFSDDFVILVLYILMQHVRTPYYADMTNELFDNFVKYVFKNEIEQKGLNLNNFNIGIKEPSAYVIGLIVHSYPLLLDLKCKLISNQTQVDFITSDNPAIFYNQLLACRELGSNTGLLCKGLQIFLPISPKLMLILYDDTSYVVGQKPNLNVVMCSDPIDVFELNILQMVGAYQNVYFSNEDENIEIIFDKSKTYRREGKTTMEVYPGGDNGERRREFIASSREDIRTNLKLSFIRAKKRVNRHIEKLLHSKQQPAILVRNEPLAKDYEEFRKYVKEGIFQKEGFLDFLEYKYGKDVG